MGTSKESYRDNPLLKRVGVKVEYTKEQFDEYVKCAQDPIYFTKYMNIITLDEGLVPFNMYDFQKDMISTFHDNRFSIVKCPRQVGKTTTAVAYLLWTVLFKDSQSIAVLANRGETARAILGKLQLAYENLPIWMQQGVVEWNKGRIELENGSVIIASSTEAMSYLIATGSSYMLSTSKMTGSTSGLSFDDIKSVKIQPSSSAASIEYYIVTT